eukprot:UC4_evm1s1034
MIILGSDAGRVHTPTSPIKLGCCSESSGTDAMIVCTEISFANSLMDFSSRPRLVIFTATFLPPPIIPASLTIASQINPKLPWPSSVPIITEPRGISKGSRDGFPMDAA